jgi:hypothetical protein
VARDRADWRQLIALVAWDLMYCLTLIVLPGAMAWRMFARRQWGLWTLLALPAVVAVAVLALSARATERLTWDTKFGVGLVTFPALLLSALVVRWAIQLRWRRLALWSLLWIGVTLAAVTAAFKVGGPVDHGPLELGESYATDGWQSILLIGAYLTGCLAVVIVPLEALVRKFGRWIANRRGQSSPVPDAASVGIPSVPDAASVGIPSVPDAASVGDPLADAARAETTAIPTGSPFSAQTLDPQ